MFRNFIQKAVDYSARQQPFAVATIVSRVIPTSGKPGDRVVISKDGKMEGWIGGGCTKGIILKEAMLAMADGKPRLVKISPDKLESSVGVISYTMTCQSGGTVQVYIEPILPMPKIHILGKTHIARAVAKIATSIGYEATLIGHNIQDDNFPETDQVVNLVDYDPTKTDPNTFLVVSTQGEGDEESLKKALNTQCNYIGFVASRKKAQSIFTNIRHMGITFDQIKRIKTPAGIDIHAKTPEEVAISILAEIIQTKRQETKEDISKPKADINLGEDYYMNPVCNIPIQKSTAKYVLEHQGEKVYFCCDGCKVKFEAQPNKYIGNNA